MCVVCFCRRLANFFFPHCPVNSRRHNNKQQPTTHNFIKKTQKTTATNKHTHTTTVPRSQLNSSRTTVCSTLWDWQQKKNQFLLVVRGGGCVHIYLVAKLFSNSIAARALNTAAKRCKQHRLAQATTFWKSIPFVYSPTALVVCFPSKLSTLRVTTISRNTSVESAAGVSNLKQWPTNALDIHNIDLFRRLNNYNIADS